MNYKLNNKKFLYCFKCFRFPLAVFAMIFSQAIQCAVGNRRIKAFLDEEEIEPRFKANKILPAGKILIVKIKKLFLDN